MENNLNEVYDVHKKCPLCENELFGYKHTPCSDRKDFYWFIIECKSCNYNEEMNEFEFKKLI